MSHLPNTQDEWTIHALNIHGVFFERRCVDAIVNTPNWKVLSTNYPVEYPPPNGPWRGKESSLDIWARRDDDPNVIVDIFIECKKANPEFVNWVFFAKPDLQQPTPFVFAKATNTPNPAEFGTWTSQIVMQSGTTNLSISNDAREVRGDYVNKQNDKKTKTSNAAIQEAAYQVALANRAIVHEESKLLDNARGSSDHPAPPWPAKAYVPIIVTTANLFRVDFASSSTSLGSGEIGLNEATLVPIQSILYEYALPKHLQFSPAQPLEVLKSGNSDTFSRMHILVVHSEALSGLLLDLFASSMYEPAAMTPNE